MKRWILDTFFRAELENLFANAKTQGSMDAFEKAHADIRETMVDDTEERAEERAHVLLDEMLSPIDTNKIVSFSAKTGAIYIGGERVDDGRLASLKSEAEAIEQFDLWHLLHETPKELAQRSMFVEGDSMDNLRKGRSMLYTLDTQKRIIDTLKAYVKK